MCSETHLKSGYPIRMKDEDIQKTVRDSIHLFHENKMRIGIPKGYYQSPHVLVRVVKQSSECPRPSFL